MTPISHQPVLNIVDKTKAAEAVKKITHRIFCDSINEMLFSSLYSNPNYPPLLPDLSSKKIDCPIKKENPQKEVNISNDLSCDVSRFKIQVVLYIDTIINTLYTPEIKTRKLSRMKYLQILFDISSKNGGFVNPELVSAKLRTIASKYKKQTNDFKKQDEKIVSTWIKSGGEKINWDLFFKKVFPKLKFKKKAD